MVSAISRSRRSRLARARQAPEQNRCCRRPAIDVPHASHCRPETARAACGGRSTTRAGSTVSSEPHERLAGSLNHIQDRRSGGHRRRQPRAWHGWPRARHQPLDPHGRRIQARRPPARSGRVGRRWPQRWQWGHARRAPGVTYAETAPGVVRMMGMKSLLFNPVATALERRSFVSEMKIGRSGPSGSLSDTRPGVPRIQREDVGGGAGEPPRIAPECPDLVLLPKETCDVDARGAQHRARRYEERQHDDGERSATNRGEVERLGLIKQRVDR